MCGKDNLPRIRRFGPSRHRWPIKAAWSSKPWRAHGCRLINDIFWERAWAASSFHVLAFSHTPADLSAHYCGSNSLSCSVVFLYFSYTCRSAMSVPSHPPISNFSLGPLLISASSDEYICCKSDKKLSKRLYNANPPLFCRTYSQTIHYTLCGLLFFSTVHIWKWCDVSLESWPRPQ